MSKALVITPVKDSIETTLETIQALHTAGGDFRYIVYNDFSTDENTQILSEHQTTYNYELVNLSDYTDHPSPNYRLVLQMAQQQALSEQVPLILVESDVEVQPDTITQLLSHSASLARCGMVGAVTVDRSGEINFPYLNFKGQTQDVIKTSRSLSFCCTLLHPDFLKKIDFSELSSKKDWYDIHISRQSIREGFNNYLLMGHPVLHKPHSSRPWKQLKYTNPLKYYFYKYTRKRDKI